MERGSKRGEVRKRIKDRERELYEGQMVSGGERERMGEWWND